VAELDAVGGAGTRAVADGEDQRVALLEGRDLEAGLVDRFDDRAGVGGQGLVGQGGAMGVGIALWGVTPTVALRTRWKLLGAQGRGAGELGEAGRGIGSLDAAAGGGHRLGVALGQRQLVRPAALAGAEARGLGVRRGGVKGDFGAVDQASGLGGAAKDPRGVDGIVEVPVGGRVAGDHGSPAGVTGGRLGQHPKLLRMS
jgi:hypothetical protein